MSVEHDAIAQLIDSAERICVEAHASEVSDTPAGEIAEISRTIRGTLRGRDLPPQQQASLIRVLARLARARAVQLRAERRERARVYVAVHEELARLSACSSAKELLEAAGESACTCCGVDRVAVGKVRSNTWDVCSIAPGPGLERPPVALALGEAAEEAIRRQRAALATPAAAPARDGFAELTGSARYVVAPVVCAARVVAVVHADRISPPAVGERERDLLEAFAEGLGRHLDALELRDALGVWDRHLLRVAVIDEPVDLWAVDGSPAVPRPPLHTPTRAARVLSPRELEVMELVAAGRRNTQIAAELVVSEATVKTHLTTIMRKLHVHNRAEAVFRFLTLSGDRT